MQRSSVLARVVLALLGSGIGLGACGRVALELPDDGSGGSGNGGSPTGSGGSPGGMGGAATGAGGRGSGGAVGAGGRGFGGSGVGGTGVGGAMVDCSLLDQNSCLQHAGICSADYCPSCPGSQFVRCAAPTTPPILCPPPPPCIPPDPCASIMTFDECDAHSECHPVFVDYSPACDCTGAGCCVAFSRCVFRPFAFCQPPPGWVCPALPGTRVPICTAPYVVSYDIPCYEGCVRKQDCDVL